MLLSTGSQPSVTSRSCCHVGLRKVRPNNAFKPNPLRYAKHMAGKACHVFRSTTLLGLTLVLCPVDTPARLENAITQLFGNHEGWGADDYLHAFADPRQMMLAYRLFFPQFEVVEGEPVLGPLSDEQRKAVRTAAGAPNKQELLASFRWVEVPYLFAARTPVEEHDQLLAE